MKNKKTETLKFTDETIKTIGDGIIENILDNLSDFIDNGVRYGILPKHIAEAVAEHIASPEEASFNKLEIVFLQARGQLHKRVREYVYQQLPTKIQRHGEEHYGTDD